MKSLITGIGGMIGSHLAECLLKKGDTVLGIHYNSTINISELPKEVALFERDVRDFDSVHEVISESVPDRIFHLAAQSLPFVSVFKPQETFDINCKGTINIFESVKLSRKNYPDYNPMIVTACSSAEYGASLTPENIPIREDAQLLPLHPYGVSKVAQDLLAYQYYKSDNLNSVRARIFNTTGPRKTNDACSDFIRQVVEIEKGLRKKLTVGNTSTKRAITDVRDLADALELLSVKGVPGEVYNISGDKVYLISEIIEIIRKHATSEFEIEVDNKLFRPVDEPVIFGDSNKLINLTGWKQRFSIERTIIDTLEYWRKKI